MNNDLQEMEVWSSPSQTCLGNFCEDGHYHSTILLNNKRAVLVVHPFLEWHLCQVHRMNNVTAMSSAVQKTVRGLVQLQRGTVSLMSKHF